MFKTEKIILLLLLIVFAFSIASPVFALELNYPSLPGLQGLEEIEGLEPNERLPAYARYILRLTFYIVVGICLIVLVAAGILYISASQKPAVIVKARAMIQRALLGLFILVASYAILYAINPQLLVLKVELEEVPLMAGIPAASLDKKVYIEKAPLGLVEDAFESYTNTVFYYDDEKGYRHFYEYINGAPCLTDGYGGFVDESGEKSDVCISPPQGVALDASKTGILASLMGKVLAAQSNPAQDFVYLAAVPIFEIERTLGEAIEIIEGTNSSPGLAELLDECKCGMSYSHLERKGADWKCAGGMDEQEGKLSSEDLEADPSLSFISKSQYACLTKCEDCGIKQDDVGYFLCDLHDIYVGTTTVEISPGETRIIELTEVQLDKDDNQSWRYIPSEWKPVGWDPKGWTLDLPDPPIWPPPDSPWIKQPLMTGHMGDKIKPERLIKLRLLKLREVLAKLQGLKQRFFPEQVGCVADVLTTNKIDYLLAEAEGFWGYEFTDKVKELEALGYEVVIKDFETAEEEKPPLVTAVPATGVFSSVRNFLAKIFPSALASKAKYLGFKANTLFFAVSELAEAEKNKFVSRQANRASLFSVLTDLSLEKIEEMFKDCLESAFGKANYYLNKEEVEGLIHSSIEEGAIDRLIAELDRQIAASTMEGVQDETKKGIELQFAKQYIEKCKAKGECNVAQVAYEDIEGVLNRVEKGCGLLNDVCCTCVRDLMKDDIPPHFVSDTLVKVFTTDIEDYNETIKELLNTEIRNILFKEGAEIDKFLDKKILDLYDGILNGALTKKKITELMPPLQKLLDTQMEEILPDVVVDQLKGVDNFLKRTIDGECRPVKNESECKREVYNEIGEDIRQCCIVNGPCRNVLNKYQCIKEVFRVQAGKKQCCTNGIRGWIKEHSEDYIKGLTREYVGGAIHKGAEWLTKKAGFALDDAYLNECYLDLESGRIFEPEEFTIESVLGSKRAVYSNEILPVPQQKGADFISISSNDVIRVPEDKAPLSEQEAIPGKCVEMTPERINKLDEEWIPELEFIDPNDLSYPNTRKISLQKIGKPLREEICRGAGYEWLCTRVKEVEPEGEEKLCCDENDCDAGYYCAGASESCDWANVDGVCKKQPWSMDNTIFTGWKKGDDCHCADRNELLQDIKGGVEAVGDLRKLGKSLGRGTINYIEQAAIAFLETTLHTAIEYAKVFIEDRFIAPLRAEFNTIVNFQKGIGKFLSASVEQILPDQVTDILQSNINKIITDVCAEYEREREIKRQQELNEGKDPDDPKLEITIHLPKGITWEDKPTVELELFPIPQWAGDTFCGLKRHLERTVLEQVTRWAGNIGEDINNALHRTVLRHFEHLCRSAGKEPGCIGKQLDKSLADIIFEKYGLDYIVDFIRGTPKQMICGELITYSSTKFSPTTSNSPQSIAHKCKGMRKDQLGILPFIDQNKMAGLTQPEKDIIVPWCYTIYTACQTPLSLRGLQAKLGESIQGLTTKLCNWVGREAVEEAPINPEDPTSPRAPLCSGRCLCKVDCPDEAMREDLNCPGYIKTACEGCAFALYNSVAFSYFYEAVRKDFKLPPEYNDVYPEKFKAEEANLLEMKKEEKEVYKWLLVYFPKLTNEIKDVALKRGFTPEEWVDLNKEVEDLKELSFPKSPQDTEELLMKLVAWRLNGFGDGIASLKDIMATVPLGVIKPKKAGESTLLLESSNEPQNFLAKTPYQLLNNYICPRIEREFAKEYPNYTLEALARADWYDLRQALPYSMETVKTRSIGKRLEMIGSASSAVMDEDIKEAYLFCESLKLAPAQILGVDQLLKTYIRPKEYIILFDLIKNELYDYERPEALNKLLHYLYESTPVDLIAGIRQDLAAEDADGTVEALGEVLRFLDTPVGQQIQNAWPADETLLDLVCKNEAMQELCPIGLDVKLGPWDRIQEEILKKTPMDLLAKYLTAEVVLPGLPAAGMSLMALASQNSVLGQPYVDTLGKWTRFDEALKWAEDGTATLDGWIEKGVDRGVREIQKGVETALLEWPRQAGQALARLFGKKMGQKASNQMAGYCYDVDPADICKEGEIRRTKGTKTECCDMGMGLVCKDRCRPMPDTGKCNKVKGEEEKDIQDERGIIREWCCYEEEDEKCKKCRKIGAPETGAKCRISEQGEEIEKEEYIDGVRVCCHKEYLGTEREKEKCPIDCPPDKICCDECCVTVMECVSNKFAEHMEIVAEMLADGEIPISTLKAK